MLLIKEIKEILDKEYRWYYFLYKPQRYKKLIDIYWSMYYLNDTQNKEDKLYCLMANLLNEEYLRIK